jgi:hypothetical protein
VEVEAEAILESLGPARRFADPNGPRQARLMAAGGTLPLPPPQLAATLFALTLDPDEEVRQTATRTLEGLPDAVVGPVLEAEVHPALLHWLAERFRDNESYLIKIALNNTASDETACFVASLPHPKLIEAVSHNQVRILRCPELVDTLGENVITGQATIDRILEFLGLERGEELQVTGRAESYAKEDSLPQEALIEHPPAEDAEEDEGRVQNIRALIQNLSVVERVKLARFGNAEARSLLVRDRNKIVATAAVRSPKVTDTEILKFAKNRSISEEVIRIISHNRDWTRVYQVQLALATNPRTAVPVALKFLNYLSDRDLKAIMRSRDVPGQVSQQARRVLTRKGKV